MPSDLIEPSPSSETPSTEADEPRTLLRETPGPPSPPAPSVGSTSGDELSAFLAQPRPDPLLGEYVEDSERRRRKLSQGASSTDAIRAIRLSHEPKRVRGPSNRDPKPSSDEELETGAPSLGFLLLASYASAVTLALAWVLWTGRQLPETEEPAEPTPGESVMDPGFRADRSRKIVEPPSASASLTTLGTPIRLGQIEVTPLAVDWTTVVLKRVVTTKTYQKGGDHALRLRLRISNLARDASFAPLDEGFLRNRGRGAPDSWIETDKGEPSIPLYPLAVDSEWSIVDQEFRELLPGETYETHVFSAPGVPRPLPESMTWMLRLRTGIEETAVLAVQVSAGEVGDAVEDQ